jgi:hypothetical protein
MNNYKYSKYKHKYLNTKNILYGGSSDINMINPLTLLNIINSTKNVAIVNVLDNTYVLNNRFDIYYTKTKFDELKDKNSFELIVFYCANYTCPAAKIFANTILEKYPNIKDKCILYEGGLCEWTQLSLIYNNFNLFDTKTQKKCNKNTLYIINKDFFHWAEKKKSIKFPKLVNDNSVMTPKLH